MTFDSALQLSLGEPAGALRACFQPQPLMPVPDRDALMAALAAHGWRGARLDEAAVAAFLATCALAIRALESDTALPTDEADEADEADDAEAAPAPPPPPPVEAVIGAVLDGEFTLDIPPDNLSVQLTLIPPQGGRRVAAEAIRHALAERGVTVPLLPVALDSAVRAGACERTVIAAGHAAIPGKPARFLDLTGAVKRNVADDNSRVDLRDLGTLVLVSPGNPLMRRIPPEPGVDGVDVFGRPLPAPPVQDLRFGGDLGGAAVDPADPDLLVAAIAGAPHVGPQGVSVSPVVEVKSVDLHSGNVAFDGTLQVAGDIRSGMSVRVTGDVVVKGTIEAARVEAGGDVVVQGGIIGKAEAVRATHGGAVDTALIRCRGRLQARFIENAVVQAGTDVVVASGIRHSDVAAGASVLVGPPRSGQGSISGGRTRALLAVRAGVLGAVAGPDTLVQVGVNPYAESQRLALEARRRALEDELGKLRQLVAFFTQHPERAPGDLAGKTVATQARVDEEMATLDAELARLAAQQVAPADAVIEAGRRLHGGVVLRVGARSLSIVEDRVGGTARIVEDKVALT